MTDYEVRLRQELARSLNDTKGASTFRINGIVTTMLGRYTHDVVSPAFFSMHWFTVVWIPVIPLGVYLVTHGTYKNGKENLSSYRFHAAISQKDLGELFPGAVKRLYLESLFTSLAFLALLILALFAYVGLRSYWH